MRCRAAALRLRFTRHCTQNALSRSLTASTRRQCDAAHSQNGEPCDCRMDACASRLVRVSAPFGAAPIAAHHDTRTPAAELHSLFARTHGTAPRAVSHAELLGVQLFPHFLLIYRRSSSAGRRTRSLGRPVAFNYQPALRESRMNAALLVPLTNTMAGRDSREQY